MNNRLNLDPKKTQISDSYSTIGRSAGVKFLAETKTGHLEAETAADWSLYALTSTEVEKLNNVFKELGFSSVKFSQSIILADVHTF